MALNINGTTGISGVDGSVSAPALTGTDSNTGITFPAADTIKFATGGVERLSITNSGLSGVGSWTHVNDTSIGTGGSYTISGIPTDTTFFRIMFSDISSNTGDSSSQSYTGFRLGSSSGLKTDNYNAVVGYLESSYQYMNAWTSRFMIISQNYGRAQYGFNGQIQCWKSAGTNKWHYLSDTNRGNAATYFWGQGEINLGASITQAQLFLNTGSFDGGSVSFSYYQD